jgi:hypothetical protein
VTTELALVAKIPADIDKEILSTLRSRMAQAEGAMEYYWSNQFFKTPRAAYDILAQFIYWDNYHYLVNAEHLLLEQHQPGLQAEFCFVGSGPLPISQMIYQRLTGRASFGVDSSLSAVRHAQRLIQHFGIEQCQFKDVAGKEADYSRFDTIFIASLVDDKEAVIAKIKADRKDKTTFIMIRSAEGLHELYYEPYYTIDSDLHLLGKTPYRAECINTTLLYRYN